jgi:carboxymethylenebutenolidase
LIEVIVDIDAPGGQMETFICRPEGGALAPAVLMLMDAPGIREELYDMARRLATCGYAVLLPNLYYRAGRDARFDGNVLDKSSTEQARMRAIRTNMTIPPVMDDIAAMLDFAQATDGFSNGPVGAHGYCMSGPYALAAAARFPGRVAAAASFYGTWLVSDAAESPHETLHLGDAELYIACAEYDVLAPADMVADLQKRFNASGAKGELEIYLDVHHGYAFPKRWCYDRPGAERHWEKLIALYRRTLG